jgi:hypothetical protein
VVREVDDKARVCYVDNDRVVAAHAPLLITGAGWTTFVQGDLRDSHAVLNHPQLRKVIDLELPVGLLMTAVIHFIADDEAPDPWALVNRYASALAPGSYLALSQVTGDAKPPAALEMCKAIYAEQAKEPIYPRTLAEVGRFFDGLQIVPPHKGARPEVVHAGMWGAEDPQAARDDGSSWMYAAVAYIG